MPTEEVQPLNGRSSPTRLSGQPRLAAHALLALSASAALVVALLAAKPGRMSTVLPVRSPFPYAALGLVAAFGHYWIRFGAANGRDDWRRFLGRLLLASLSLSLSLLVAEVGLRFALARRLEANSLERLKDYREGKAHVKSTHPLAAIIEPSPDPDLVFELRPNIEMSFGHHPLHTNGDGMRSLVDFPHARSPKSVRIVGLGDSGMFGWNMDQGDEYLGVLERNLNARGAGIRYEVLNLAVPGYNTPLEVEMLRHKGLAYDPDVVIVGWCENDFDPAFFVLPKVDFRRADVSFLYTLLFDRPNLTNLLQNDPRDLRSFAGAEVPKAFAGAGGKAEVVRALAALKQLSDKRHFHVLVFGPLRGDIIPLAREAGLDTYDTYEHIPPDSVPKEWAVHFMHPRKEGHQLLAERLAQTLAERGWLTPRASGAP